MAMLTWKAEISQGSIRRQRTADNKGLMSVPGMGPLTDCQIQVVSSSSCTHTNKAKSSGQLIFVNRRITMKEKRGYDFKKERAGYMEVL